MVTQNTTTAGAASAARHIQLTEPQANQQIVIDNIAGAALDMGFPSEAAQLEQSGQDLVFLFENGGRIVLSNFFGLFESNQLPAFNLEDGQTLPGDAFLAALREDLLPAAGPGAGAAAGSGGVGDYDDNAGDLIGGVDRLDPLGTGTFGVTPLATIEDEGIIDPANGTLLVSITTGVTTEIPGGNGEVPLHPDQVPPGTYVGAFEDWQPNQHLGFTEAFAAAFGFTFTPDDNEVLNSITFIGPIDGHLLVSGVEVLPNGAGNYVIAAADIGNVTLLPNADSGTDIPLSGFATITDPDSGLTGTVPFAFTAVVDAVADRPLELGTEVTYGPFESISGGEEEAMEQLARWGRPSYDTVPDGNEDSRTAADPGGADEVNSAVHITLSATFGDYQDGSEQHYLIIEKKGDWTYEKVVFPDGTELDLSEFLEPGSEILMLGSDIAASGTQGGGLDGIKPDGLYYVIPVGDESITGYPNYTDAQGQLHAQATKSVTLVMYPPDEPYQPGEGSEEPVPSLAFFGGDKHDGNNHDYQEHFVTGALAVDRDADGSLTTVNDASLVLGSVTVEVAPADGSFKVTGQHWGLEDPQAYVNDPWHGSLKDIDLNFKFTPDDDEVLDNIQIALDPTKGTILVGGDELKAFGAEEGQKSYYVTEEDGQRIYIISADDMHRVTLMPPQHSDADVTLTVTAHFHDPDSGDTATRRVTHTVLIDAVADKPDVHVDVYQPEGTDTGKFEGSFQYGEQAMVKVTATFYDLDGSEEHTVKLFIPKGFELPEDYEIPGGGVLHETPFGNYISWEVPSSQADFLQDIPVVYTGSANSGSVKFVASATAVEVDLSGEELTRLNNWAGDSSSEWVQIKDKDPHAKDEKITFDEDRLNVADPLHDGTNPSNPSETTATLSISGNLTYGFGYSDPATGAFKWKIPSPNEAMETDIDDGGWGNLWALKSGDTVLEWELIDDGRTLIGKAGDAEVIRIELTDIETGAYKVTLSGPIDHPDNEARGTGSDFDTEDILRIEIPYTITDEFGRTASGELKVSIMDDAPVVLQNHQFFTGAVDLDGSDPNIEISAFAANGEEATVHHGKDGVGVDAGTVGVNDGDDGERYFYEIDYMKGTGSEVLQIDLTDGKLAQSVTVEFGLFYGNEGGGEQAKIEFWRNGVLVDSQTITSTDTDGSFTHTFTSDEPFDSVRFSALPNGSNDSDNSDYAIKAITFGGGVPDGQVAHASGEVDFQYGADGPGKIWLSSDEGMPFQTVDGTAVVIVPSEDGKTLSGYLGTESPSNLAFTLVFSESEVTGKWEWEFSQYKHLNVEGDTLDFRLNIQDRDGDVLSTEIDIALPFRPITGGDSDTIQMDDDKLGAQSDQSAFVSFSSGSGELGADDYGFAAPAAHAPSVNGLDGDDIVWTRSVDHQTLTGRINGETVIELKLSDGGSSGVTVTATLHEALDHENGSTPGGAAKVQVNGIQVEANDGTGTATSVVNLEIADSAPTADHDTNTYTPLTTNVVVMLDVSGSMDDDANGSADGSATRLDMAVSAITQLLQAYDDLGAVNVKLVWFSENAQAEGWLTGADAVQKAVAVLAGLDASGWTNYDAAINLVKGLTDIPDADRTVGYFLSDGEPNRPSGSAGIDPTEQAAWETFLKNNDFDMVYAFGMGTGISGNTGALDPIGWTPALDDNDAGSVAIITDMSQLAAHLLATVPTNGWLLSNDDGGADGDKSLYSVTVDGTTYDINHANVDASTHQIEIDLGGGKGTLTVDFDDGFYTYTPGHYPTGTEVIGYTMQDGDGTRSSATLTLTLNGSYVDAHDNYATAEQGGTTTQSTDRFTTGWDNWSHGSGVSRASNSGDTELRLNLNSNNGNNDTRSTEKTFMVNAGDTVSFDWRTVVTGDRSDHDNDRFEISVSDGSGTHTIYTVPGDSSSGSNGTYTHTFNTAGTYTITLRVVDGTGGGSGSSGLFGLTNNGLQAYIDDVVWTHGLAAASIAGHVISDQVGTDIQDQVFGTMALVTEVNGVSIANDGAYHNVMGDFGMLHIKATGEYTYEAYGKVGGHDDAFVYKLTGVTDSDYATLNVHIDGSGTPFAVHAETNYEMGASDKGFHLGTTAGDTIHGTDGNDVIFGNYGDDTINGKGGNDYLHGGHGNDILSGGDGNDILVGGQGEDTLTGGGGADTFMWNAEDFTTSAVDRVKDFTPGEGDVLRFADVLLDSDGNSGNGIQLNLVSSGNLVQSGDNAQLTLHHGTETQTVVIENVFNGSMDTSQVNATLQAIEQHILNHKIVTENS